ncbi:MAG TPA: ATP-binding protein [Polyangiaceae bacterium]|nr:ATP-binding protein [Polyangiaceae bacterium]
MKLSLRAQLFLLSLGVVIVTALLVNMQARPAYEASLMTSLERDLAGRARLVAALAEARRPVATDMTALQQLASELGTESGCIVELLRADGMALANSEGSPASLSRAREKDVMAARAHRRGHGSPAFVVEGRRLYSSFEFRMGDGSEAVARVGTTLLGVDHALGSFRDTLIAGGVLLFALLLVVTSLLSRLTARGLGTLNETARRMAAGDLEARSGLEGEDAPSELGRTLDKLAKGLSSTLKELRGERDRMAGILEGMQEGVLLLDAKRRIVVLNPALREMLLLPADAVGKPLLEVVRNAELRDLFAAAAADDEPTTQEVEIGSIKPRRLLARVARMPGEARQLVAVFVDVTEVRRLESMRRDFVANVSHELRTPVTSIRSAAETLMDGAATDPAAAQAFIAIIDRNAQRLQSLVEDLLDLSRIESRGFRLSFEPIELKPIFSQVIGLFRERAGKKKVSLEERALGEVPKVRADRRALEHVLTNLIDNAVKYCGPGTHVWLAVHVSAEAVTINVSDDGPGIDERHLPRIFERFYRVDAGRSREVGGTGLGLSIVKHLVEAMGGSVSVESKLNSGTTFSFTLRRAEPEQLTARAVA